MTSTLPTVEEAAAIELRQRDYWPVAIYRKGAVRKDRDGSDKVSGGKDPIGAAWGAKQKTEQELRRLFRSNPGAGVGLCLGPYRAPGGRWFIDFEGDGPRATESLKALLGGDVPTMGHASTRGSHNFFVADTPDAERFLALLVEAKAEALNGEGKAGVYKLAELPDLEIRIGGFKKDQTAKQCQSVVPPTQGDNGKPREWHPGVSEPAELPEAAYAFLAGIAERKRSDASANHAAGNGSTVSLSLSTQANGALPSGFSGTASDGASVEDRVIAYLATCEPAISNQGGHDKTFGVFCRVGPGFDLQPDVALRLIATHYNPRCLPPWSDAELRHKVDDAYANEQGRGWLLNGSAGGNHGSHGGGQAGPAVARVNEAIDDPHRLARLHLVKFDHQGERTLQYYRGECLKWSDGAYRPVAETELQAGLAATIKDEFDRLNRRDVEAWEKNGGKNGKGEPIDKPIVRKVTRPLASNVTLALQSMSLLAGKSEAPSWIADAGPFDPVEIMPIRNALVSLPSVVIGEVADPSKFVLAPTPRFFSTYSLDFDFDPGAGPPFELLKFLSTVWLKDRDSIDALQEWFGYCLLPDTRQQKIGMFIGPKRSGRGTIARLLRALVGAENVAGPRLLAFASNFGLEALIGKPLAVIGDARLSGRSDTAAIVEALLSISGEDTLTIERKYKPSWTGRLPTRLMLISNELPRLPDQSGALASRFIVWRFTESFHGREDLALDARLTAELPSILLWAIQGWQRLRQRGHFVQPKSGIDLVDQMRDISSPVGAFVQERVATEAGKFIPVADLFAEWCQWCDSKKRQPGDEMSFGRNLRTVLPWIETKQHRGDKAKGEKPLFRCFEGITWKVDDY